MALIVPPVSAQYVTEQGESIIRTVFALNVAEWGSLSMQQMVNSIDPPEIKRVKVHPVKCSKCKANLMIKPTEKECPVCGNALSKPEKR